MPRPILIMLTGDVPEKIAATTGNFDDMFLRMADYSGVGAVVRDVAHGEDPGEPDQYSGSIVTGSPAMVTDREPWSEQCGEWLRRAVEGGHRVFGVCYGHQLMGQAFGGVVEYLPYRMELGTQPITLRPGMPRHPLLPELPSEFKANLIHSQAVMELPPNASALAYNEHAPHQLVGYGPNAISMQFHPEFDRAVTQYYIDVIAGTESPHERARAKDIRLGAPAEETPEAAAILQHFVSVCRREG